MADYIQYDQLDSKEQKLVQILSKRYKVKPDNVHLFETIHGKIVLLDVASRGNERLTIDDIKFLSKLPIRWFEGTNTKISAGF